MKVGNSEIREQVAHTCTQKHSPDPSLHSVVLRDQQLCSYQSPSWGLVRISMHTILLQSNL